MARTHIHHSVVLRLVACLVLGGLVISAGLAVLQWRRSWSTLQMEVTQEAALTTRNLQNTVRGLSDSESDLALRNAMSLYTADPRVRGVRLSRADGSVLEVGVWDQVNEMNLSLWPMPEHGIAAGDEVNLHRLTLIRTPIVQNDAVVTLSVLIDGPLAVRQLKTEALNALLVQWLLLAVMTLLGLLLVRQWVTAPLAEIVGHAAAGVGPEPFYEIARREKGEFAQLAGAIGGMLTRIDATTQRLHQRERAFEDLYQFAPAAMLSLDQTGRIVEANRRAANLMGVARDRDLIGLNVLDLVRPEDRGLARQTVDRLDIENLARCELRLDTGGRRLEVMVEATGVRDDLGALKQVRLSLLDITHAKQLQREVVAKSRLLRLVVDHMSDAILLIDAEGKIAAYNQRLATLVNLRNQDLTGHVYDPGHLWEPLGPVNAELFASRMKQIQADQSRPAQECFETRVGTFRFEGIPVHDDGVQACGRLWVVQDISHEQQVQSLLSQQTAQLQALRQLSQQLVGVTCIDDVLLRVSEQLYRIIGAEVVGVAIRRDHRGRRSQQLVHRGVGPVMLEPNLALLKAVEQQLMPQVLDQPDVMYWPDLTPALPWARTFQTAGLTSVAAVPLKGSADAQGVLWIARRGGERVDRNQIYMLQGLGPVVAARIEFALQRERMQEFRVTDTATDLPNAQQFQLALRRLANRPGYSWAVALVKIDHFRKLNERVDHETADKLLREAARELQRALRKNAFVARLTGPVFGIMLPDTDPVSAKATGQRLRQVLAEMSLPLPEGDLWQVTASASVATSPHDGTTAEQLYQVVSARLDVAKAAGGNRLVTADDAPSTRQAG